MGKYIGNEDIQFFLLLDGSSYHAMYKIMFADLKQFSNVKMFVDTEKRNVIKQLLLKDKVQQITKGKLDYLAYDHSLLKKYLLEAFRLNKKVCVVFTNAALYYNSYLAGKILKYKKRWKELKTCLLYLDIINTGVSKNANYLRRRGVFDYIYTIDSMDAEKINAKLIWTPYSQSKEFSQVEKIYDLYFCGASKNRSKVLNRIIKESKKNQLDCHMDIVAYEDCEIINKDLETIRIAAPGQYRDYQEVLNDTLKARCILDVVQENQRALTLRPFEAVCYNRKLLTNNKTILNFPYYNPDNIQYFESVDDIDWDWLKKDTATNYKYNKDFSPVNFINDIVAMME